MIFQVSRASNSTLKMPAEKVEEHPATGPAIQDGELAPSGAPEPAADGADDPELYGDVMQALGVPEQLAGATAALQEQLLMITREMQNLKKEMYSEQGGLTAQLASISQRTAQLDVGGVAARNGGSDQGHFGRGRDEEARARARAPHGRSPQPGAAADAPSGSGACAPSRVANGAARGSCGSCSSGLRERLPTRHREEEEEDDELPTSAHRSGGGGHSTGAARGRRVEFTPDTHDPIPMRQRGGLTRSRQPPPEAGWSPYIIGFFILCFGPLRPLVLEFVTTVPSLLRGSSEDGSWSPWTWLQAQEEPAWYEQ